MDTTGAAASNASSAEGGSVILSPSNFEVCDAGATENCEDHFRDPTSLDMMNRLWHNGTVPKLNAERSCGCHDRQATIMLR